ncbi:hypothetical protein D3C74_51230 [compost metagenome]
MDDITLRIIKDSVFEFRNAIELLESNEHPNSSWFAEYPKGCCGDTSDLLAKYLLANGIKAEYVWGMWGDKSHAWLEINGYIITLLRTNLRM